MNWQAIIELIYCRLWDFFWLTYKTGKYEFVNKQWASSRTQVLTLPFKVYIQAIDFLQQPIGKLIQYIFTKTSPQQLTLTIHGS